jgi:hypothetical protein
LEGKTDTAHQGARFVGCCNQWYSNFGTNTNCNATLKKKYIKAQRVILEAIQDHLIPHVSEKASSKEMFDALVSLFQRITRFER